MFRVMEGGEGDVLAVEISQGYTRDDVEEFKQAFQAKLAEGHARVNLLVKIDGLKITDSQFMAFVDDCRYALKSMDKMRHIAIVGTSSLEKALVRLDNLFMGKPGIELIEKYFDLADIKEAWDFVKS